jgi:hypothetical protein
MTSLMTFSETERLDYPNLLNRLPAPNLPTVNTKRAQPVSANTLEKVRQKFSETWLSSRAALQELLRAKLTWEDQAASTFYHFEAELQTIEAIYLFRNPAEVIGFLQSNRFLAPILIEASLEIGKHFNDPRIVLEVDRDEEERSSQQLVAYITTNFNPAEALRRLKQFDEDWWLDVMDLTQGRLCISLEYE